MPKITASKLYDYLQCKHKVWRDAWGPQEEKNPETNPFVELLWERGVNHEKEVIKNIGEIVDVSLLPRDERFPKTLELMKSKTPLVYQGVLQFGGLYGIPDLLRLNPDGTYTPIDIKSGRGIEGVDEENSEDEGKLKKHYAVQLALYLEILRALGFSKIWEGYIYDIDNKEVCYSLLSPMGIRNKTLWVNYYEELKTEIKPLLENTTQNLPALMGACKLCPWYQSCTKWLKDNSDPTLVFYLGRAKRDVLFDELQIKTVEDLVNIDIAKVLEAKAKERGSFPGLAEKTLKTIINRAKIMTQTKKPVIYQKFEFPKVEKDLFFDIEDDPTQGFIYLHGVYERSQNGERFLPFTAKEKTPEAEKQAWADFINYLREQPKGSYCLYYYSKHEPTSYKKLREQYPDVITQEELDAIFAPPNAVDLYFDVIYKLTDWPLSSYSLKEIAHYLGFNWRDKTPSGALSIQWFNEYLKTKNPKDLQRIVDYNEDDCKATMIIKDGLVKLMYG